MYLLDTDTLSRCRFRTKKDPVQSCYIPKTAVKDAGIYYRVKPVAIIAMGETGNLIMICFL
jgi:hypothetical protein